MVMKVTWESVKALDALLQVDVYQPCAQSFLRMALMSDRTARGLIDLHISPDIEVAARDVVCAEENMAAVTTSAVNPDGVLATVGGRAVEGYLAALVAVRSINGPRRLVPSALEVVGDLGR